jgi:hypothetical protein
MCVTNTTGKQSQDSSVGIVNRLWAGQFKVRSPADTGDF